MEKLGEIILGEEVVISGTFGILDCKNSGWFIG